VHHDVGAASRSAAAFFDVRVVAITAALIALTALPRPNAKGDGARVIATTRTSKKAAALREAGADVVIATRKEVSRAACSLRDCGQR